MGAVVNAVEKGGPADKAGLEPGDVILKFDGKPINASADLPRLVAATKPGTRSTLQVWRKGTTRDIAVTVGEMLSHAPLVGTHSYRKAKALYKLIKGTRGKHRMEAATVLYHAAKGAGQAREPAGKALSVIVEDELHVILTEADAAAAISRIADRMKSW